MVHEEGMKLAAVAPTWGDLHRAHLEGIQPTLLRCFHFVSYSFSSKSLGATCSLNSSTMNLSAGPSFQNSHEIQLYQFTTSCKTTRRVVFANWYFIRQTTTCLLCSGHVKTGAICSRSFGGTKQARSAIHAHQVSWGP